MLGTVGNEEMARLGELLGADEKVMLVEDGILAMVVV